MGKKITSSLHLFDLVQSESLPRCSHGAMEL